MKCGSLTGIKMVDHEMVKEFMNNK